MSRWRSMVIMTTAFCRWPQGSVTSRTMMPATTQVAATQNWSRLWPELRLSSEHHFNSISYIKHNNNSTHFCQHAIVNLLKRLPQYNEESKMFTFRKACWEILFFLLNFVSLVFMSKGASVHSKHSVMFGGVYCLPLKCCVSVMHLLDYWTVLPGCWNCIDFHASKSD